MDDEDLGKIGSLSPGTVNHDPVAQGAEGDVGGSALDRALDRVAAQAAALARCDRDHFKQPRSRPAWSDGETASRPRAGAVKVQAQQLPAMIESDATIARALPSATKFSETDQAGRARTARGCEITPPVRDEALAPIVPRHARDPLFGVLAGTLAAALGLVWIGGFSMYRLFHEGGQGRSGSAAVNTVVERIIQAESGGDPNAKNARSSATGAGQFLDETWLELIRAHRGDLAMGRSDREILELRRNPELSREITARFVERNAAILSKRGLPVTPGTLYLAHFAGPAGAVAILTVPDNADAASLLASADASGRTTRRKIVAANPFLEGFTVADLKSWAERKMRGPGL